MVIRPRSKTLTHESRRDNVLEEVDVSALHAGPQRLAQVLTYVHGHVQT